MMRLKSSLSRAFVVIGAVLVAAMVLFPPWTRVGYIGTGPNPGIVKFTQYDFILSAHDQLSDMATIDVSMLALQVLVVLAVVALVVLASESGG